MKNKVAVVTGSSKGIGRAIAIAFAKSGTYTGIVTNARKLDEAEAVSDEIKKLGCDSFAIRADISKEHDCINLIRKVVGHFNRIDVLVNNAGFPFERKIWFKKIHEISEVELVKVLQVDLIGSFRITKEVLKTMIKKRKGIIINIASTPAIAGNIYGCPYSIAKAGLINLTKHISLEYGQFNIRSYSVALGNINTYAMRKFLSKQEIIKAKNENSMKRWGQPEEIAKSIVSLATENFSFSTGNTIIVDGGAVII